MTVGTSIESLSSAPMIPALAGSSARSSSRSEKSSTAIGGRNVAEVRAIPGFDGRYWVSESGEVFNANGRMKTYKIWNGYERVDLGKRKMLVHRLVAMAFIENPNGYEFVNHLDGIKVHNHRANLEWCTKSQNALHAFRTGIRVPANTGCRHAMAKLTEDQVVEIRRLRPSKTIHALAKQFNVSPSLIHSISVRKIWKSVP